MGWGLGWLVFYFGFQLKLGHCCRVSLSTAYADGIASRVKTA